MSIMQVLLQSNGPLPISAPFKAPASGPAMLYLSGSAWTQTAGSSIGITVSIDGDQVAGAWIYANEAGSHMSVVPVFTAITLPDSTGTHTITIAAMNKSTVTDVNDNFQVTLMV